VEAGQKGQKCALKYVMFTRYRKPMELFAPSDGNESLGGARMLHLAWARAIEKKCHERQQNPGYRIVNGQIPISKDELDTVAQVKPSVEPVIER
jgi:hypothetical protein